MYKKFKFLDHPVDEETYLEHIQAYAAYLKEAMEAQKHGENIDEVIEQLHDTWKAAGILDEEGYITPEYTKAFETLERIQNNEQ